MNTEDFKPFPYVDYKHSFGACYIYQEYLSKEFMLHEPDVVEGDFDINCFEDQKILKDYLQIRVIEEITEATLAITWNHFLEEIADAFNFLISAYAIYGLEFDDLPKPDEPALNSSKVASRIMRASNDLPPRSTLVSSHCYDIVEQIGKACNLLKNRPWKQTQFLVDVGTFENELKEILMKFYAACWYCDITLKDLFEAWSLKFQVNQFRLATMY